ncbi:MAG: ABC transporter permease [Actinomycetota bacterium]|nr:ABC transporter permease [Actinomycetota bacterium]
MTTVVLVRRFLTDYVRNPVNLLLLALVPTVFVVVAGGSLADAAELLGGPPGSSVQTATAGWAAGFLAGIAMFFQTAAMRDTDRRVVIAGIPASQLALARLLTGACLALLAATTALVALAARTGIDSPGRAVAGTLMFAVIYVAIGAGVGSVVSSPVNGTVIVLFVWMLDVFFGPAMGAADRLATRGLPTHFVTLWMVDLPSGHGGRIGDLGWALVTTAVAAVAAWALAAARSRTAHRKASRARPGSWLDQVGAAWRAAWKDARRNPTLWVLFVLVPVVFILGATAITPNKPVTFFLAGPGGLVARTFPMPDVHAATMAPIAIGSLAALTGLFTVLDSRAGDRRAALAGLRPAALLTARLGVLALAILGVTVVALATTALVFDPERWPIYAAASLLIGVTYGLIGALLAPVFGRVGGVFVAFLLPFLELGIVQSPLLHATPTTASRLLPGYGGSRVLLDGALLRTFDDWAPLLIGVGWLVVLTVAVTVAYRRATRPARTFPAATVSVPAAGLDAVPAMR